MTRHVILAVGIGTLLAHHSSNLGAQSTACTIAAMQAKAPKGTTITGAEMVAAAGGVPAHCRVDGYAASSGNEVNFRLALPDGWNGKFLFLGVGGLGGTIANLSSGLLRGYASASTDTGHVASDREWWNNRAKEIDYGYRGTHVTAVASKALTASFYGKPPQHAYFSGCSNGGRQAMMEVQRYPEDFDGVIAGHPATGTPMQVGRAIVYQHMLASIDNVLTDDAIEQLSKATLEACDKDDGLEDGLIDDPRTCTFDVDALTALTPGQRTTIKKIYAGLKTKDGNVYAHGFPVGHEGGTTGWRAWISGPNPPVKQADGSLTYAPERRPSGFGLMDPNFRFLALDQDDPNFNWKTFTFDRDLPRLKTMTEILTPADTDLRPFKKHGGKLIIYHGWADPGISAMGTVDYYEQMVRKAGGQKEADAFARLYMIPGMHHCSGGVGTSSFDMLDVLEQWVEKGIAPASVPASRIVDDKVVRTRPLCPHPAVARYKGTGSVDEASSFECKIKSKN